MNKIELNNVIEGENSSIYSILSKAMLNNKLHHAYLISGPSGIGKTSLGIEYAKALLCKSEEVQPCGKCSSCTKLMNGNHPDFKVVSPVITESSFKSKEVSDIIKGGFFKERYTKRGLNPDILSDIKGEDLYYVYLAEMVQDLITYPFNNGEMQTDFSKKNKSINIGQFRKLQDNDINMPPTESKYRVILIDQADSMNVVTQNSFLKTLEEPPLYIKFILTTSRPNALLPTVNSRCQHLKMSPLNNMAIKTYLNNSTSLSDKDADFASLFSGGSIKRALEFVGSNKTKMAILNLAAEMILAISNRDKENLLQLAKKTSKYGVSELSNLTEHLAIIVRLLNHYNLGEVELVKTSVFSQEDILFLAAKNLPISFYPDFLPHINKLNLALERNVRSEILFSSFLLSVLDLI